MSRAGPVRWLTTAVVVAACASASGQPGTRRVTTVEAIQIYPGFYHAQPVLVRGELRDVETRPAIVAGETSVRLLSRERVPAPGAYDVRGEALDIGRLSQDDPRLSSVDLRSFGIDPADRWPRQGEVVVLRATSFDPAQPLSAPSIRALALDPWHYEDQHVTVAGQFRGRNLFGDLPQAPAAEKQDSKGQFVLKSGDAALWVLGKQPKGHGFELDPDSRIDSRRWLEVSGVVHYARGLVWIEAQELKETEARAEAAPAEPPAPPPTPIPPEVLFSAPAQDETDVPLDTHVRIQFSRDLKVDTLRGHISVHYSAQQSQERGEPQPPRIQVSVQYDPPTRALDIAFTTPPERFRTVMVDLLEGITGTDGAPLKPWTLSFTLGGS
jgi:hypothetical protein